MPTNREIYFSLTKENNKYLSRLIIKSMLNDANGFNDQISLYKNFDNECLNYDKLMSNIERIRNGEPYQYVLGYSYFIDNIINVNKNTLIPRHETEELVINTKLTLEKVFDGNFTIGDICTGSGCIAIALKKYFPKATVYATDIDKNCVDLAKENSIKNGVNIEYFVGNLVEPLIKNNIQLDVLIANPPYIKDVSSIDEQVLKYEPHLALLADPETKYYEEIFKAADILMKPRCFLAFEIGEDMQESIADLVEQYFPDAAYKIAKDMYGKIRFLFIARNGNCDNN